MANVITKIKDWRTWRQALLGAFIGGALNCVSNFLLEPQTYNIADLTGTLAIVKALLSSGAISAGLWIKQHPKPDVPTEPEEKT